MVTRILFTLFSLVLICSLLVYFLPTAVCQPTQEEVPSPPAEEEAPIPVDEGKVLNLYGIDPHRLDPAVSGEMTSHQYILQLFSGLVCLDDNLEPAPDIAQEWEVSDDGRTYTFYLRHDVRFHNGRGVIAEDFQYSWQRACDPATGSLTAATYLGDIVGVSDVLAGESKEISGVRVIDDYTLQVTIDGGAVQMVPVRLGSRSGTKTNCLFWRGMSFITAGWLRLTLLFFICGVVCQ